MKLLAKPYCLLSLGSYIPKFTAKHAKFMEYGVIGSLLLLGLAHHSPYLYYQTGLLCFAGLLSIALIFSITLMLLPRLWTTQRPENYQAPKYLDELWYCIQNVFVIAFIAAWPVTNHRLGMEVSLKWRLEDTGDSLSMALFKLLAAFVVGDAFFYWQHRLFHTPQLYIFHKLHHSFRNPSPFAIFAVHPVQTLSLYFPIWTHSLPHLNQWAPLFAGLFVFLAIFIMYIHSDRELAVVDKFFSAIGFITATVHNSHHKHSRVHYGGLTAFWDWLCDTGYYSLKKRRKHFLSQSSFQE